MVAGSRVESRRLHQSMPIRTVDRVAGCCPVGRRVEPCLGSQRGRGSAVEHRPFKPGTRVRLPPIPPPLRRAGFDPSTGHPSSRDPGHARAGPARRSAGSAWRTERPPNPNEPAHWRRGRVRLNAAVSKTVGPRKRVRGFESLRRRQQGRGRLTVRRRTATPVVRERRAGSSPAPSAKPKGGTERWPVLRCLRPVGDAGRLLPRPAHHPPHGASRSPLWVATTKGIFPRQCRGTGAVAQRRERRHGSTGQEQPEVPGSNPGGAGAPAPLPEHPCGNPVQPLPALAGGALHLREYLVDDALGAFSVPPVPFARGANGPYLPLVPAGHAASPSMNRPQRESTSRRNSSKSALL